MLSNPNHYILHIIYSIWTKKYSLQHYCQDLGQYICIFGVLYSAQQPGAVLCWYVANLLKMRLLCCFYEHQKWQKWSSVMDRFLFSENISWPILWRRSGTGPCSRWTENGDTFTQQPHQPFKHTSKWRYLHAFDYNNISRSQRKV